MTTNKSHTKPRGERGRSRRMILEGGGILASLGNVDDVDNDNNNMRQHKSQRQRRSVPKKTSPPKTLIISKSCSDDEEERSSSYDVENDVSALESPSLQPRRVLDDQEEDDEDSSSTCSEEEDGTSDDEEEGSVSESTDEEEASGESEDECDDDDDDDHETDESVASEDDEEFVADEESLMAQVNEDDIEINNEDHTEESDYDPDDEAYETEEDEDLETDDCSEDERRVSRLKQKVGNSSIEREESATINVETKNDKSKVEVSAAAVIEENFQEDEDEEIIAEVVEDSDCEDSDIDISSPTKEVRSEVQVCTSVKKELVEVESPAYAENNVDDPPHDSDSMLNISSDSFQTSQGIDCQAVSSVKCPQGDKIKSSYNNQDENILDMILKQPDRPEGALMSSLSSSSEFGVDTSHGVDHSNERRSTRSEKVDDTPWQEKDIRSKPTETSGELESIIESKTDQTVILSVAGASADPKTKDVELTVPTDEIGGLSIAEQSITTANIANTEPSVETKIRRLRREGSVKRGQWKLGSKIGSGAFGVVHVGLNTRVGSLMAVKSIKMEKAIMKDVRVEIDLLKSLDHTNIVRYLGAQMDEKYLHIFQEWVPGGSLTGLISKFGAFPMTVVRNYLSQILEGLAYLHEQNIMHRDLKGSNVLVSDSGVVKLADFGAGKKFESLKHDMMLSLTMRGSEFMMLICDFRLCSKY